MLTDRIEAFGWRTAVACGLLWAVGVTLADTLAQPVADIPPKQWLVFTIELLFQWSLAGLVWSIGAKLATGRLMAVKLLMLLPLAVVAALAGENATAWLTIGSPDVDNFFVGNIPLTDFVAYLLWMNAFYGGLYVAGYLTTRRASHLRRRLAEFRLARSEADTLLREASVRALRSQVQPATLLSALAALRERYSRDPAAGDALFDLLISFLRTAMPSVRSGLSTLSAELETVQSYELLRRSLLMPGARWRFALGEMPPAVPFPSLILLPVLEAAALSLPDGASLALTVSPEAGGLSMTLSADRPAHLPQAIGRRLRGGLKLIFGNAAVIASTRNLPIDLWLPAATKSTATDFINMQQEA